MNKINKIREFTRPEHIVSVIIAIIVLSLAWSTVKVIQRNYDLQQEISVLKEEVGVLELEKQNLELGVAYYNTDSYLELEAKKKFNKVSSGEKVIVLPKNISPDIPDDKADDTDENISPENKSNFDKWMDFLLGREPV